MTQPDYSQTKIWVVSAWLPEQEQLIADVSRGRKIEAVNSALRLVGPYAFLTTGVGTPRAAAVTASVLSSALVSGARLQSLYFVATAGAYKKSVTLNSAFLVSEAAWSDGDLATKRSYLPNVDAKESISTSLATPTVPAENRTTAMSTPGITLDNDLALSLSGLADLENLEIYGIALAAQQLGVSWGAALGISNTVGSQAHEQWKANHRLASRAAQELLMKSYPGDFSI